MNNKNQQYLRGQVWYCDLSPVKGSEQGGVRPVVIIQNNMGNKYAPTVIGAIITSRHTKAKLPTHIWVNKGEGGLHCESMVECEQIKTLDKTRLLQYMGILNEKTMEKIDKALKISLGLE